MDHEWFAAVNRKLREIEEHKAKRFKSSVDKELHLHTSIANSRYWHHTDTAVPGICFDYRPPRFPNQYVKYVKNEDTATVNKLASRPYRHDTTEGACLENTKTLVARIVMLGLEFMLPEV